MDSVASNKACMQPKTMAELLPGLSGIIPKDTMFTLTAKKQPRSTTALTRTSEKNVKPLTIAEMRADILALKVPSPKRNNQLTTSTRKKIWNASVRVDSKIKSHTAEGQLKNNPVRKVLNFQPNPKVVQTPMSTHNLETPKFPKREINAKKTSHPQDKNSIRISGIYNMPDTSARSNRLIKNRITLANKDYYSQKSSHIRKTTITPISKVCIAPPVPDTPLPNTSWKSSSDASFLQREKELDVEDKTKALPVEPTLENIAEVSPPVSTPFKEYRNVQEFFNHSRNTDNSALYNDDTIMCFDKISQYKENNKREESIIVTLCDLLNKASVANVEESRTGLSELLEVEKQLEHNIKMVENGIRMLTSIKESQLKSLHYIKKVKLEENAQNNIGTLPQSIAEEKSKEINPRTNNPVSGIKAKSPSYKIPKKNSCLRKNILNKSVSNISDGLHTPNKDMDKRAFNMYMEMKMKDNMCFLSTPCVKYKSKIPDTPAMTSHNLQMQLNKIYKDDT